LTASSTVVFIFQLPAIIGKRISTPKRRIWSV
jgi:hypothetical protein